MCWRGVDKSSSVWVAGKRKDGRKRGGGGGGGGGGGQSQGGKDVGLSLMKITSEMKWVIEMGRYIDRVGGRRVHYWDGVWVMYVGGGLLDPVCVGGDN